MYHSQIRGLDKQYLEYSEINSLPVPHLSLESLHCQSRATAWSNSYKSKVLPKSHCRLARKLLPWLETYWTLKGDLVSSLYQYSFTLCWKCLKMFKSSSSLRNTYKTCTHENTHHSNSLFVAVWPDLADF